MTSITAAKSQMVANEMARSQYSASVGDFGS